MSCSYVSFNFYSLFMGLPSTERNYKYIYILYMSRRFTNNRLFGSFPEMNFKKSEANYQSLCLTLFSEEIFVLKGHILWYNIWVHLHVYIHTCIVIICRFLTLNFLDFY